MCKGMYSIKKNTLINLYSDQKNTVIFYSQILPFFSKPIYVLVQTFNFDFILFKNI